MAYGLAFEFDLVVLEGKYGEDLARIAPILQEEMANYGFRRVLGNMYANHDTSGLVAVYEVIERLSTIEWFKNSVRSAVAFKIEDISDFTETVNKKEREKWQKKPYC